MRTNKPAMLHEGTLCFYWRHERAHLAHRYRAGRRWMLVSDLAVLPGVILVGNHFGPFHLVSIAVNGLFGIWFVSIFFGWSTKQR